MDNIGYICAICKTPNTKHAKYCMHCGQWLLSELSKPKPLYLEEYSSFFGISLKNNKAILIWFWITYFMFYFSTKFETRFSIALTLTFVGLINLIYPLKMFNFTSRKMALIVSIVGFLLTITSKF